MSSLLNLLIWSHIGASSQSGGLRESRAKQLVWPEASTYVVETILYLECVNKGRITIGFSQSANQMEISSSIRFRQLFDLS